ncbi:MAG TPA: hypothetical protein VFD00_00235 [Thermoclostridium sp.]|nr:hypothetical protein [Thermoclostridium sp.]
MRWITGGVTIDHTTVAPVDGKRILPAGMPIGKITASGKYGPYHPAVTGVKAVGEVKVDGVTAKIEGEKSAAYNGVEVKFVVGAEAGGAWAENVLTLTLVAATNYGKTELESLIAAATTGAPTGVDVSKIAVTIASAKSGTNWAAAGKIVLAGGIADVSAADDGRQNAALMIAEEVDVTEGDKVITAFDWARVISARIPVSVTSGLKADLTNITFV